MRRVRVTIIFNYRAQMPVNLASSRVQRSVAPHQVILDDTIVDCIPFSNIHIDTCFDICQTYRLGLSPVSIFKFLELMASVGDVDIV